MIPPSWDAHYPIISLTRAGLLLITGHLEGCAHCLDEVERLVLTEEEDPQRHAGRIIAMRCNLACFQNDLTQAEALAKQALGILPHTDLDFRAGVYVALGDTYRRNAYWDQARECYQRVLDYQNAPTFRVEAANVFGALADLDLRQGRLRAANAYWKQALAALQKRTQWTTFPLPLTGWIYIRMAEILYEWNELPAAKEHVDRGLERAELGGDVRARISGYLLTGRLHLTEGNIETAVSYLEKARALVRDVHVTHWINRFERFQVECWLAQKKLRIAVDWARTRLPDSEFQSQAGNEDTHLALARVLIAQGESSSLQRALAMLNGLIQTANAEGRMGVQIEALALQALAHWRRNSPAAALSSLAHALRLAEPEGYVRLFADFGLPMARLLHEARARKVLPEYAEALLIAFGDDRTVSVDESLPEPLTPRELEVLKLVAAGLTNREISEALVISPETVKKHTSNIYGKLAVGNRREAVAMARKLVLLS